jgi:hypothetical protein
MYHSCSIHTWKKNLCIIPLKMIQKCSNATSMYHLCIILSSIATYVAIGCSIQSPIPISSIFVLELRVIIGALQRTEKSNRRINMAKWPIGAVQKRFTYALSLGRSTTEKISNKSKQNE